MHDVSSKNKATQLLTRTFFGNAHVQTEIWIHQIMKMLTELIKTLKLAGTKYQ